jgi:hypothetical protein
MNSLYPRMLAPPMLVLYSYNRGTWYRFKIISVSYMEIIPICDPPHIHHTTTHTHTHTHTTPPPRPPHIALFSLFPLWRGSRGESAEPIHTEIYPDIIMSRHMQSLDMHEKTRVLPPAIKPTMASHGTTALSACARLGILVASD